MGNLEILTNNGIRNAAIAIELAIKYGLELAVAAAFLDQESEGAHIYGRDWGGTYSTVDGPVVIGSTVYPKGSLIPVTHENYWGNGSTIRGFHNQVLVDGKGSNGVGPLQITYPGYLTQASNMGYDLSNVSDAMAFGMYLLSGKFKGDFSDDQIKRVACFYNTGFEDGWETQWYALEVLEGVKKWRGLLGGSTAPVVEPVQPVTPQVSGYRWTTDYLNFRDGAGTAYKIIGVLPRYVKVEISGKIEGGWYQVRYNGVWGWCSGAYLSATQPVTTPTTTTVRKKRR